MKKYLLSLLFAAILFFPAYGQSLRWGMSGGSSDGTAGATDETVTDVATDPNGNIYVLGTAIGPAALHVGNHSLTGYGAQDIILSSYTCNGTYRWSKVLGGSDLDIPAALKTDALGGVYVAGYFSTHYINIHLDSDTTWATGTSYKALFVLKYDTGGNYKWLNMPQPDTAGPYSPSNVRAFDLDVDSVGNVYAMFGLAPGAYAAGSYIVPAKGVYIFKYSNAGTFLSGTPLQIQYDGAINGGLRMKLDAQLGQYYITGNTLEVTNLMFNGNSVTMPLFVGAFNSTGNLLWQRTNTSGLGQGFGRASIDNQHNIYLSGVSQAFNNTDTFNSYPIINTISTYGHAPVVVKMNSFGNNIWLKNISSNHATYLSALSVNSNVVTVAGSYNGKLVCTGLDSFYHPTAVGEGYDIFILRLDAGNGNFLKLDSITSGFPDNEFATGIAADVHGNVYIGGDFSGTLDANTDTLSSVGGGSDFFMAKYGYDNCGCTNLPVANYTYALNGINTVNFTYTGTTAGLDSVKWDFGDGNTTLGTTVSHAYNSLGTYSACVTAYTSCGSNEYCDSIFLNSATTNLNAFSDLKIYPNPLSDKLILQNAIPGTQVAIYNVMGVKVFNDIITNNEQQINTTQFLPGTYLIQLQNDKGDKTSMVLIK